MKSGCTHLFLPPSPGPGGPPTPAHWQGAHADAPFSVFCRLGSASSCGEEERYYMGEGPPPVPALFQHPPMYHRNLGPNPKGAQPLLHP